ncbi:hypothetical protein DFR58_10721 [Anaerobacterium chartisolvens]|uniref:Calcineurin-like phosphoesterase domain-containing protein n=1 Tax=Anaerobacterium chartisolvens TaxID=1297424 RepID=A0A369BA54_9FIRM|nr:metallophosphoesterase [Anaerobacterium chartisolvens]RCX17478.1 hypothetical protein DFR58_10721 [Anaerobacterium chartisolvens]
MVYLYIFFSVIILLAAYMRFEAGMLLVRHVWLTKSTGCLKVIQLSDIHTDMLKVSVKAVKAAIDKENPDAVIMTGDYISKPEQIPAFLRFIKALDLKCSAYMCLGNHDYKAFGYGADGKSPDMAGLMKFISSVEDAGIAVLDNKAVCLEKSSKSYNLIGIGDLRYNNHNVAKAMGKLDSRAFANLCISHNPDIVFEIPRGKIDYLFCGHFHGGQIWAPFNIEFSLMRKEKLCRMGINRGLHSINGINLYINRGLGNVCVPLRFLSPPELTVFYLP